MRNGGVTRDGAIYRSGHLDRADADDWARLRSLGVTTVIDLRNSSERAMEREPPDGFHVLELPLEDVNDPDYRTTWAQNWAAPDFYAWGRLRWPELWRAVFDAVSGAPGAVVIHCAGGRDRTGMLAAILLATAGVERAAIIEDYLRGIREAPHHDIAAYETEYVRQLVRLLDDLDAEPELTLAAVRLR